MKQIFLTSSILSLILAQGSVAWAQVEETPPTNEEVPQLVDEIVVTGSRLQSGAKSEPVTIINAYEIERRGIVSVDQLLRQVTSNSASVSSSNPGGINGTLANQRGRGVQNLSGGSVANLRGLGTGSTLVLVNGRRIAGDGFQNGDSADISAIPIESIERVEILTSGASAIYGADAVAGVINIILKKDYDGGNVSLRHENSSSGGDLTRAAGTFGKNWETGNLTVSGSYADQSAVNARKFGIVTRDFTDRGGLDLRNLTSATGAFSVNPFDRPFLDPSDPFSNDAFTLPTGFGGVDFDTDINDLNLTSLSDLDELLPKSLSPSEETYALSARFNQDVSFGFINNVFVDVLYTNRETKTEVISPRLELFGFDLAFSDFGSPFIDEFFEPRTDVDFVRDLSDAVEAGVIPNDSFESKGEDYSLAFGVEGDISQNWSWTASASFGENKDNIRELGFNATDVYFGVFDNDTFDEISAPFNLVRSDFTSNPDAGAALQNGLSTLATNSITQLQTYQGVVKGSLLTNRKAGALEVAFGYERRDEDVESRSVFTTAFTTENDSVPIEGTRSVDSFFAEASFPIFDNLVLNGAVRHETVNNKGETVSPALSLAEFTETGEDQFNPIAAREQYDQSTSGTSPRLGVSWEPAGSLELRGTVGRSFRAPNSRELADPSLTEASFDDFIDPQTGEAIPFGIPILRGGNLNLKDERARTYNAGFTFAPQKWKQDVSFSVDWYNIRYKDRVGFSFPFRVFDGEELQERDLVRDASGNVSYLFEGPINTARENLSGFDFTFRHYKDFNGVDLETNLTFSKELERESKDNIDDPFEDEKGIGQSDFRLLASSTLSKGSFSGTLVAKHFGGYESDFSFLNDDSRRPLEIDSVTTFDLQMTYALPEKFGVAEGLKLKVGATNIFDADPPETITQNGFDVSNYDNRRRVLYLEIGKSF